MVSACFLFVPEMIPASSSLRCREDAPKPPEENPVISATSSGHLIKQEAGDKSGKSNYTP